MTDLTTQGVLSRNLQTMAMSSSESLLPSLPALPCWCPPRSTFHHDPSNHLCWQCLATLPPSTPLSRARQDAWQLPTQISAVDMQKRCILCCCYAGYANHRTNLNMHTMLRWLQRHAPGSRLQLCCYVTGLQGDSPHEIYPCFTIFTLCAHAVMRLTMSDSGIGQEWNHWIGTFSTLCTLSIYARTTRACYRCVAMSQDSKRAASTIFCHALPSMLWARCVHFTMSKKGTR